MSSFKSAKPVAPEKGMQTEGGSAITYEQVKTFLVVLTPILAPIGGFVSRWVAQHFPGGNLSPDQATTVFIAGIAAVVFAFITLIVKDVLKGKPLSAIPGELEQFAVGEIGKLPDGAAIEQLIEEHLPDVEAIVKQHLPDIEAEIEAKLPTAASDALRQLLSQLGLQQAASVTAPPTPAVAQPSPAPQSAPQTAPPVAPQPPQQPQQPPVVGAAS